MIFVARLGRGGEIPEVSRRILTRILRLGKSNVVWLTYAGSTQAYAYTGDFIPSRILVEM